MPSIAANPQTPTVARPKSEVDEEVNLTTLYESYFVPAPSPLWHEGNEHFSLDQPWPKFFPETESSYGNIETLEHA